MTFTKNMDRLREMERALAESTDKNNSFVRDGDATHMRFDEIALSWMAGAVEVAYKWRGATIYTMRHACNPGADVLSLCGMEGRMLVTLA